VWPGRHAADQHQDQDDQENGTEAHGDLQSGIESIRRIDDLRGESGRIAGGIADVGLAGFTDFDAGKVLRFGTAEYQDLRIGGIDDTGSGASTQANGHDECQNE
jgi:hypothetical protein